MARNDSLSAISTPRSKLRPPRVRHTEITRTALLERLLGTDCDVLAICGPAGYGKSTLAIQWASASQRTVIWVTIDESDDDAVVLITTLCSALSQQVPSFRVPDFIVAEPALTRLVLPAFVSSVAAIETPLTLVLDDVHLLSSESARKVLKALANALPIGSQIAFVGRSMQAIPLPLWRGQGRAAEILAEDLSFSEQETAAAVADFDAKVRPNDVHTASGGWPVAVFLLSQSSQARWVANVAEFIEAEVLQAMPPELRTFVMATAAVGSVNAELAACVSGRDSAGALLAETVTTVLIARDENGWYRYHPLMQECVRQVWGRDDPAGLATVQAKAARWYLQNGHPDAAVVHAIESGDLETMGHVVWPAAKAALLAGRVETVQGWLQRIGSGCVDSQPELSMTAAWANVSAGDFGSVLRHGIQTLRLMPDDWLTHPQDFSMGSHLALLQAATHLGMANPGQALEVAQAANATIGTDDEVHSLAVEILGLNQALVGEPAALMTAEHAVALAHTAGIASTEVEARAVHALVQIAYGQQSAGCDNIVTAQQVWAFHDLAKMKSTGALLRLASVALASLRGREQEVRQAIAVHLSGLDEISGVFAWYRPLSGAVLAFASARIVDHSSYHEYLSWCHSREGLFGQWVGMAELEYASTTPLSHLTPAEVRVWELLKGRMTLNEIAGALFLSRETVKSHTGSIYRKLGVASRREAQELAEAWGR